MSKLALLLSCLLLGACGQEMGNEVNTVDEIVQCVGDDKLCTELTNRTVELLPVEVQNSIVDTSDRLVIYTGIKEGFLDFMSRQDVYYEAKEFSGITLYNYQQDTMIYAMADEYVIIHELAHAYDFSFWCNGYEKPSSDPRWIDAYETEFISQHGADNEMEFYAETFAMYFRNPKLLKTLCPKAYALHNEAFGDLK